MSLLISYNIQIEPKQHSSKDDGNGVLGTLSDFEVEFFKKIVKDKETKDKPFVLWGWKRDKIEKKQRLPESRTIYFSADLDVDGQKQLIIKRAYLFLDTRAKNSEIENIEKTVNGDVSINGYGLKASSWRKKIIRDIKGFVWRLVLQVSMIEKQLSGG